ncbi:MAG: HEAT repeat domain-containing protein [Bdellovibrionales bacterium]|nr:HEAT repeat domain-containing protein [Bdellovibrionales bacterium]
MQPKTASLVSALSDRDPIVRTFAAESLRAVPCAEAAVRRALVEALKDAEAGVRYHAAGALAKRGLPPQSAVQRILDALDPSERVPFANAVSALAMLGEERTGRELWQLFSSGLDEELAIVTAFALARLPFGRGQVDARPVLLGALESTEEWHRREALLVISLLEHESAEGDYRHAMQRELARFAAVDPEERRSAARSCAIVGTRGEQAVRPLIDLLSDSDRMMRHYAAVALRTIGTPEALNVLKSYKRESSNELFRTIESETVLVQREVAVALGAIGQASEATFAGLREALRHEDSGVRYFAMRSLQELGAPASALEEELAEHLEGGDKISRSNAVNALAALRSERAIPALKMTLQDRLEDVRVLAAIALEEIGAIDGVEAALPVLTRCLADSGAWYQPLALRSLVRITVAERFEGTDLAKALDDYRTQQLIALRHRDVRTRREAARVLSNMGVAARPAREALVEALDDRDAVVKGNSIEALRALDDPGALEAVERRGKRLLKELLIALDSPNVEEQRDAVFALGRLGAPAAGVAPRIVEYLDDERKPLRRAAARALGTMGAVEAIAGLIDALDDHDWGVRSNAARSLGSFHLTAQGAVPKLLELLRERDLELRKARAFLFG